MLQWNLCAGASASAGPGREVQEEKITLQPPRLTGWRTAFWLSALAIFCFTLSPAGLAQTTALLSGTVQDASGGVIPSAEVTLTNEATKDSRVVQTNGTGLYAFPSLVPGTYDLKASAKGFKASQVTGIVLNAGDARTVPVLALTVGAATETVSVAADSEMIPVENGQKIDLGDGLWNTMSGKGTYRLFVTDPQAGEVAFLGSIREDNTPAMLALRLKVKNRQISEIETFVQRSDEDFHRLDTVFPVHRIDRRDLDPRLRQAFLLEHAARHVHALGRSGKASVAARLEHRLKDLARGEANAK